MDRAEKTYAPNESHPNGHSSPSNDNSSEPYGRSRSFDRYITRYFEQCVPDKENKH